MRLNSRVTILLAIRAGNLRKAAWQVLAKALRNALKLLGKYLRHRRLVLYHNRREPRLCTGPLVVLIALGRNSMSHLRISKSLRLALLLLLLLLGNQVMEPRVVEGIGGTDAELGS